jgi:tetratricopeptide (TPR) repeat protein
LNTSHLLSIALRHHQAGALAEAEKFYHRILAANPRHADALHLLGVMANQVGKPAVAIALIGKAIAINPSAAAYHNNLGNALVACGDSTKAEMSYQQALLLDRRYADAHFNLARLFKEQGRLEAAIGSYQAALRYAPGMVAAHISLGEVAAAQGEAKLAMQHCEAAVRCEPKHAPAQNALGNALLADENNQAAKTCYERAVAIDPNYADAHYNLGNVLRLLKDNVAAMACYQRAAELSPRQADTYNNMGLTLSEMGQHADAIECFNHAIGLEPDFLKAYQNRGVSQEAMGDLAAAETSYRRGLELQPEHQDLRINLGSVLAMRGDRMGIQELEQVVVAQPHSAEAHWHLSMAQLLHGDYLRGWREYEWRWQREAFSSPKRDFKRPQWRGEALEGVSILLHAEQGLGDTLQFVRYVSLVAECGGKVILEVQPGLHRLLECLPGVSVCVRQGDPLPDFSFHCPLMSLPFVFQTTEQTIPPVSEHLSANRERFPLSLPTANDRLKVGLAWAGNPGHQRDRLRSIPPKQFFPLTGVDSVDFISLQKGAIQATDQGFPFYLPNPSDTAKDFYDTAALVAGLDLVITVDTSIAHLAGSLGKPVWILLSNLADWRWGLHSDTTPWYPTARLFRQTHSNGWEQVMKEVTYELVLLADSKKTKEIFN